MTVCECCGMEPSGERVLVHKEKSKRGVSPFADLKMPCAVKGCQRKQMGMFQWPDGSTWVSLCAKHAAQVTVDVIYGSSEGPK